jgi:signal transduction histidine kinase
MNKLTENINKCLKAEENLRLEVVREEKRFKELIANISHDLRTPLTAIKGYQQLLENSNLTSDQKNKLQIAQKYAGELGGLIESFFEYSYLVNADLKLNMERTNITNLVTECLAAAVASLEERGLMLQLDEAPSIFILADQGMTVRIVQNLIRNCEAHSAGNIKVKLKAANGKVVLSFLNPVNNAAEVDVNRIFDRFYTGDRARSKTTTGLGLSIVKLLAEQMEGTVNASMEGNELTVTVEFPMCRKTGV